MHILGGVAYVNRGVDAEGKVLPPGQDPEVVKGEDGVKPRQALQKANDAMVNLKNDFITTGPFHDMNVVTDTHFGPKDRNEDDSDPNLRGRMGRSVAFLAKMATDPNLTKGRNQPPRGLAAEGTTAVEFNTTEWKGFNPAKAGVARVVGSHAAYLLTGVKDPGFVRGTLSYTQIQVVRLTVDDTFDYTTWKPSGGEGPYYIDAAGGTLVREKDDKTLDVYGNRKA
jgi:hypothetical protein